ncbi:MAG: SCO family protein [Micavibrio sp.]|nr:SCO family protein [Micavibrio sp.]
MNPQIKKRLLRTLIICAIAFAAGAVFALIQEKSATVKAPTSVAIGGAKFGGDFEAINDKGEAIDQSILGDGYSLIYFGFTYCPAICPTELQKMARALREVEKDNPQLAAQIQSVFISIDPERDTPDVLESYVPMFHPRIIGVTGSVEQINQIKSLYKVYAKKVREDDMADDEYIMDHSSYIYLVAPDGELISLYGIDDGVEKIVQDIKALPAL